MKSPIIEVVVGNGQERTTYSAHEVVLIKSPEFAKQVEQFAPGGARLLQSLHSQNVDMNTNTSQPRQIIFTEVDIDAMGSVVEYLYTGEYFPKKTSSARDAPLEKDPR